MFSDTPHDLHNLRRKRQTTLVLAAALLALTGLVGTAWAQYSTADSGTVNVQVADRTHSVVDATTTQGAFVSYFGDLDTTFGSSGTGIFDPFVRLQGTPTEQGYNTNGTTEFDTKVGKWTHAILVSHIPQRPCPGPTGTLTCFELFVDINENNSTSYVSLNKVEVYFTNSATLTGYPFSGSAALEYSFAGDILIHDVNQGSGRGDLRYDIPINNGLGKTIPIPANCNYGNPTSCCTASGARPQHELHPLLTATTSAATAASRSGRSTSTPPSRPPRRAAPEPRIST